MCLKCKLAILIADLNRLPSWGDYASSGRSQLLHLLLLLLLFYGFIFGMCECHNHAGRMIMALAILLTENRKSCSLDRKQGKLSIRDKLKLDKLLAIFIGKP